MEKELQIAEDGEIVYDGSHGDLDKIFPKGGVIKIKQAPPMNHDESQEHFKEMLTKHKVPVKKQRVILKPKKLKLPQRVDLLDEETFSDVIYDSDKD